MAKHLPGVIWSFWKPGTPRNGWVRTYSRVSIEIVLPEGGLTVYMSRHNARLLARRISQCLDATK